MPQSGRELLLDKSVCALDSHGLLDRGGLPNAGGNVDVLARWNTKWWLYVE
jgi:hypothetical protein